MITRRTALKSLIAGTVTTLAGRSFALAPDVSVAAERFGVKGDGETNDRISLQRAIDQCVGKPLLISGAVRIDAAGLVLRRGSHIRFSKSASIKLLPHSQNNYQIFRVWDTSDVTIEGAAIDGSRELCSAPDDPRANGYGMGISIAGSSRILLRGVSTKGCWGDGIYIANSFKNADQISSDITVFDHHADACRRQGVSIISGRNVSFIDPVWENIGGTLPSAGLDIEPNSNHDVLERIVIKNPLTRHCRSGIEMWLDRMLGPVPKDINIKIYNHRDEGSINAYKVMGLKRCNFGVTGNIVSEDPTWVGSRAKPEIVAGIECSSVLVSTVRPKIR
ncbi:hypothetical protein R70199_07583 [Paraburkholderia domus]|nr:hypothetical protein R70199_07583 [Paraburkholderia domus]